MPKPDEKNPAPSKKLDAEHRQLTVKEYQELQAKEAKKFKLKIPFAVRIILAAPLIVLFLFGIFYIPFLYIKGCSSSPPSPEKTAVQNK